MEFSLPRTITIARLVGLGYHEINRYSDGVILLENAHGIRTFVGADGKATKPHTAATQDAYAVMLTADIDLR